MEIPGGAGGVGQDQTSFVNLQMEMFRQELASNRQMMLSLIEKIGGRGDGASSTFGEIAAAMSTLKDVIKPTERDPMNIVSTLADVLKKGIEIGASGGKSSGGWGDIVKDVLHSLPAAMAAMKVPVNGGEAAHSELSEGKTNLLGIPNQLYIQLCAGIAYLKGRARLGKSVDLWVDTLLDNLDQPMYRQLAEMISVMPIEEIAKATDPDILNEPYRQWFQGLIDGVNYAIRADQHGDGGGSNSIDAPKDGTVNAGSAPIPDSPVHGD